MIQKIDFFINNKFNIKSINEGKIKTKMDELRTMINKMQ